MNTRLMILAAMTASPFLLAAAPANAQDRYCREYTKSVRVGGQLQSAYGTACMQPDGSWEIVSFGGHDDLYEDIARDAWRGQGRVVRIEHRAPSYWYPAHASPVYYRPYYRQPVNVFSFSWRDGDDNRRHWKKKDRHGYGRGHDHHRHKGRGHGHRHD